MVLTGADDEPARSSAATRLLEGASTAASVPVDPRASSRSRPPATSCSAARRRPASRARRWPGSGVGVHRRPEAVRGARADRVLPQRRSSTASRSSIYWLGVKDPAGEAEAVAGAARRDSAGTSSSSGRRTSAAGPDLDRGQRLDRRCGSASRSSSSRKANPDFPDQALMRGFDANQITIAAIAIAVVFGAGLLYWGNRFKAMRRTTIIGYGIVGGGRAGRRRARRQPLGGLPLVARGGRRGIAAAVGLFVLAGATPAALGLLADISERFPTDRGAIMGLYSVFLAHRPDHRQPDRRRSRRTGAASTACSSRRSCCSASPSCRWPGCATQEHELDAGWTAPADRSAAARRDRRARPWARSRWPAARTARSSRRITSRPPPGSRSCGRAAPRSTRRSRRTPSSASSCPAAAGSAATRSG